MTTKRNVFDCLIRDAKEEPPLGFLDGWPHFWWSQCLLVINLFYFVGFGDIIDAFIGIVVISSLGVIVDALSSNNFSYNVHVLRLNGFSDWVVLRAMIINVTMGQTTSVLVMQYLASPEDIMRLLDISSYSLMTIAQVVINLSLTEVLFYYAHEYLHEKWPSIHLMHHCCVKPSGSTNLIFDPLDLMVEFGGPGTIVLLNHFLLWNQNITSLLVSYIYIQCHYTINHHEWAGAPHIKHHTKMNATYTIYIEKKGDPRKDKVRTLVKPLA